MDARSRRIILLSFVFFASFTALASCGSIGGCTAIGCVDQIEVTVRDSTGAAVTAFHGTVVVNGTSLDVTCGGAGNATADFRCPASGAGLILTTGVADTIHVSLTADVGGHSINADLPVTSQTVQPNGPNCAPTCHQGRATAVLM